MSAHTPGPWRTAPCAGGGLLVVRPPGERGNWTLQTHVQIIPDADALLIAAAPEMYGALCKASSLLALTLQHATNFGDYRENVENGLDEIRAALAKVGGAA